MELPEESLRPHKAKATKPGQPTLRIKLTDDEWREYLSRDAIHQASAANQKVEELRKEKARARGAAADKAHHESLMSDDDTTIKTKYRAKVSEIDAAKNINELESIII